MFLYWDTGHVLNVLIKIIGMLYEMSRIFNGSYECVIEGGLFNYTEKILNKILATFLFVPHISFSWSMFYLILIILGFLQDTRLSIHIPIEGPNQVISSSS